MPHGTCFTDIVLEPGYVLRLWSTDLPQYYHRMAVSEERARSNAFTDTIEPQTMASFAVICTLRPDPPREPQRTQPPEQGRKQCESPTQTRRRDSLTFRNLRRTFYRSLGLGFGVQGFWCRD